MKIDPAGRAFISDCFLWSQSILAAVYGGKIKAISLQDDFAEIYFTRKSSCVNARGIPTAVYTKYSICCPIPVGGRVPTLAGGGGGGRYPSPCPDLTGGSFTCLGGGGDTYLGLPPSPHPDLSRVEGYLPWWGEGVPTLGYPPSGPGLGTPPHLDLSRVPPHPV